MTFSKQVLVERRAFACISTSSQVLGIKVIQHIETLGEPLFQAIVDDDHETSFAKRIDAPYRAGPRNTWGKRPLVDGNAEGLSENLAHAQIELRQR